MVALALRPRVPSSPAKPRPEFRAPFYSAEQTVLHRYLDAQFVNRFTQDLQNDNLAGSGQQGWLAEDRFGEFRDHVTLRQPVHRTFYMLSCEVNCSRQGKPALDRTRIVSAGFVIRRRDGGDNSEYAWMLENGNTLGWRRINEQAQEPDVYRRLCNQGVIQARHPRPAYSGEEVYPLHVTQTKDGSGRLHTILYGYLPVGGGYVPQQDRLLLSNDEKKSLWGTLPWPLKASKDKQGKGKSKAASPSSFYVMGNWQAADGVLVNEQRGSRRFANLLKLAINRYHIGESDNQDNNALLELFDSISFHSPHHHDVPSLGKYLRQAFTADGENIHDWLQAVSSDYDLSSGNPNQLLSDLPGLKHDAELVISEQQAQEINTLLAWRLEQQILDVSSDMPLPKFEQAESDLYFVRPFIRIEDCCQEEVLWGEESRLFRVAAPFDPEASRPSMIQMPTLKDLKRGMANGVGFLSPPDVADTLRSMHPEKGLGEDLFGASKSGGLSMICSFSLPVITFCAMIMLMIIISILNIFFFWIPWVFSCIPFPGRR